METRKCCSCHAVYPATKEFFYGNRTDKLGIERRCKTCDNKKTDARKIRRFAKAKSGPCVDCGVTYPACVMSFDHLPDKPKNAEIWQLRSASKERLLEEIANCDLVCLNCHALRTHVRSIGVTKPMRVELRKQHALEILEGTDANE